jgi:hypothetical protein
MFDPTSAPVLAVIIGAPAMILGAVLTRSIVAGSVLFAIVMIVCAII